MPRTRRWTRGRAGLVVNLVIVLAVALVGVETYRAVHSSSGPSTSRGQTARVDTGNVVATVTASGNVAAATTTDATFEGSGGIVTAIYVKAGQKVHQGQALAKIDQTTAQQGVETAQAQLDAAEAGYETTAAGKTPAQAAQDRSSIASAQQGLSSAELSLRNARQSAALTRSQQDAAVRRAERAVAAASTPQDTSAARSALTQARNQRATALLQASQQVEQQEQSLKSARLQLTSARTSAAANSSPTSADLASAKSQVTSAQVALDQARTTLGYTTLRAPVAGTVSSINGSVGESSSGSGSSASTGSSSGASTGASTGSTSTTSATTSTSSGFVTLTSATVLEVTADVAEADITNVAVGQPATVTLSASDGRVAGTVTHVDTDSTVTNNVVEYGVTVRLDKAKGVRLGATAQLTITTGEKNDVTRVSTSALTTVGNQTTATVRESDGTTRTVAVTTGLAGDGMTQVISGLTAGETVVVPQATSTTGSGFTFPGAGGGGPGGAPGGIGGGR